MKTLGATEVRRNWSEFLDGVIHERPQAVQRNRDTALVVALPQMEAILSAYRFNMYFEREEDGTYTGSLEEIDLMWNAKSPHELKRQLAEDLIEYAETYLENFNLYYNSPNRKAHFPYVLHVSLKNSVEEVMDLITKHAREATV